MNRMLVGALGALLLVASGLFWWQGRAAVSTPAIPSHLALASAPPTDEALPDSDAGDAVGPGLPEASEQSREQKRFDRLDKNRDGKITRTEMLSPRVKDFRKLDVDGNNLLTFDEWAVTTDNRFKAADKNGDGILSREEFATTRPKKPKKPACKC
jgi:EF hand